MDSLSHIICSERYTPDINGDFRSQKRSHDMKLMKFIVVFSGVFIALCSCNNGTKNKSELASVRYLALGDSYTIGQGIDKGECWPIQLGTKLREMGFAVDKNDIIARNGWETTDLLNALAEASLKNYNLVSLLIGVNNQYTKKPFETYTKEFDLLINEAIELVGENRIFVVSIPDYGVTPFGSNNSEKIALELDEYNEYAASKCQVLQIPFINITEISRRLGDSNDALATDSLHPSGTQYGQWVEEMLPSVLEILNE